MPASGSKVTGGRAQGAARLYSVAMTLALLGLGASLALREWLLAIPFAVLLLDAPVPQRFRVVSFSVGAGSMAAGIALHSWFVIPIAMLFLISQGGADSAIRRGMNPDFTAEDLARLSEAIRSRFPAPITGLPRARRETLTTRALLDAAIAADPGRWVEVKLTEPRTLSTEGGEVAATGWTIAAGEAALIAMNFPNASRPLSIHELAIAAMLLPRSNAKLALGDDDRAIVIAKVAGLSVGDLSQAMGKATRAPGGQLILRRVQLHTRGREFAGALPVGDWRELPNPLISAGPGARPSSPAQAPSPPAAVTGPIVRQPSPSPAATPADAGDGQARPAPAAGRPWTFHTEVLMPAFLAWRLPARILWWAGRPLCTIAAVSACCLAPWYGAGPLVAAVAALAVLVIRPARHLWISVLLAVAVAWVSPVAAAAVAARAIATFVALWLNGPGWRAGLDGLAQSRRGILGVPDIKGAWQAVKEATAKPGELMLAESLGQVAAATWCAVDIREFARQGWGAARGLLTGHWPFGRVHSAEALMLQMVWVESATSRLFQALTVTIAGLLALLAFHVGQRHAFGHDVSRLVAVAIAVAVAWPRAWLRKATRPGETTASAIADSVPMAIWVTIVSVGGYFAIGLGALWIVAASLATGVSTGLAAKRLAQPTLTPRPGAPQLPLAFRCRKEHDIWQAARTAMADGDIDTAERIWRQLAEDPASHPQVSALAKAMMAGLSLDRGAWQESVEWAEQALRAVLAPSPGGYLTRTIAARVMLAAGIPERSVTLIREAEAAGHKRRIRRDPVARMVLARALATIGGEENAKEATEVLSRGWAGLRGAAFGPLIEAEALVAAMSPPTTEAADRLRSMLGWVTDPLLSGSTSSTDRKRLETAAARAWLALGDLELRLGKPAEAEPSLRRALNAFPPAAELTSHATAQVLLGCAICARGQADGPVPYIESGLSGLEEARGQLRDSFMRSQLVIRLDDVYTRALDALITLQPDVAKVGDVAAVLLESLRRDALASLLRGGDGLRLDPETRALQREIDQLELAGELSSEQARTHQSLRERLSAKMSALYADAYAPVTVTLPDLRRRAAGAHALTFKIVRADPDCLQAYSVWIPAGGEPLLQTITIRDGRLLEAIGLLGREAQRDSLETAQFPGDPTYQLWADLGGQLLPEQLNATLASRAKDNPLQIFVVPDGILAAFPWAGLRIADGRHLIEVASIHVTPAIGILPDQSRAPRQSARRGEVERGSQEILLHCDADDDKEDLLSLSAIGDIRLARDRAEIEAILSGGGISGAYFAAHGHGNGLDQQLDLVGGGQISAASALTLAWPSWLIFASCLVGTMRITIGSEPTGLVTSCLLGGAASVIAGVVEVNEYVADTLCVSVAARISRGQHPADALRHAQLAFIASRDSASIERWAGYICVSKMPVLASAR
jgi:tetratricopeptide (TPR) repeat protein